MQPLAFLIVPAERGGYSAHRLTADAMETLLVRLAVSTPPAISVSEQVDLLAWIEEEIESLGGSDAPRASEMGAGSTQQIAARHAPQKSGDEAPRGGMLRSIAGRLGG